MNRIKLHITAGVFALVATLFPSYAYAQSTGIGITNISSYDSIEEFVLALLSIIQPIVILVFVAMIMYGGWTYLTSQGDPEKTKRAQQIMVAAIIGFVIIVLAPSIVQLLASIVGVDNSLVRVN